MSVFLNFAENNGKEIISVAVPLLIWFLTRRFEPNAKLVRSIRHSFTFLIQEPLRNPNGEIVRQNQTVQTASVVITNRGKRSASHLEIVFNWKPPALNIWPQRAFDSKTSDDGRYSLLFENLAPKEQIQIELLSVNNDLPAMVNVRSEQCVAIDQAMTLQPVLNKKMNIMVGWLMLSGAISSIYLALTLLQYALL